jgi:hypothetical protein
MGVKPTLYESLILPLRRMDETDGGALLYRFLERPQYHVDKVRELIDRLPELDDPITCPDDLLMYLAAQVGFGGQAASIVSRLEPSQIRKIMTLAVPFWRSKGSVSSLQAIAKQLTGRRARYVDYFHSRCQLDTVVLADEEQGNDAMLAEDAFWSNMEMLDDGTIDRVLLLDLLALIRPINETLQVTLYDYMDFFDASLDRWQTLAGSLPAIVDDADRGSVCAIPAGTIIQPVISIVPPDDMSQTGIKLHFNCVDPTTTFEVRWYDRNYCSVPTDAYFAVQFCPSAQYQIRVLRSLQGINEVFRSTNLVGVGSLVDGVWYTLRIDMSRLTQYTPNRPYMKLYVDNIEQYRSPDTGDLYFVENSGAVEVLSVGGGQEARIDNVRIWRNPLRWASLSGSGVVKSESFDQ